MPIAVLVVPFLVLLALAALVYWVRNRGKGVSGFSVGRERPHSFPAGCLDVRGGVRWKLATATFPFARLLVDNECLEVATGSGFMPDTVRVYRSDIANLEAKNAWVGYGLRVCGPADEFGGFRFRGFDRGDIARLAEMGWLEA